MPCQCATCGTVFPGELECPACYEKKRSEMFNDSATIARLEEEVAYLEGLKDWYKESLDEFKQRTDELIKKLSRGL